jgi:hypothetical protein
LEKVLRAIRAYKKLCHIQEEGSIEGFSEVMLEVRCSGGHWAIGGTSFRKKHSRQREQKVQKP